MSSLYKSNSLLLSDYNYIYYQVASISIIKALVYLVIIIILKIGKANIISQIIIQIVYLASPAITIIYLVLQVFLIIIIIFLLIFIILISYYYKVFIITYQFLVIVIIVIVWIYIGVRKQNIVLIIYLLGASGILIIIQYFQLFKIIYQNLRIRNKLI